MEETTDPPKVRLPQKRFYRQRAHSNPISDHSIPYPRTPEELNNEKCELNHPTWKTLYPQINDQKVEFADIGCGFGGFLKTLGELYEDKFSLGMEIRVKVSDYVMDRIETLRILHPGKYQNVACVRTNSMKYLVNYFQKAQLSKMFFLFPDPHFKKSKHKWRIINPSSLSEYAYVLREGGLLYIASDVKDLFDWMTSHLSAHPSFERLSEDEVKNDVLTEKCLNSSEEAKKVERNNGSKFITIYRRI